MTILAWIAGCALIGLACFAKGYSFGYTRAVRVYTGEIPQDELTVWEAIDWVAHADPIRIPGPHTKRRRIDP
jgi:hypothetical protein